MVRPLEEQLKPKDLLGNKKGSLGSTPLKGYDVAYAFVGYSLWSFERGNILGALHWAEVAEKADETRGYPYPSG